MHILAQSVAVRAVLLAGVAPLAFAATPAAAQLRPLPGATPMLRVIPASAVVALTRLVAVDGKLVATVTNRSAAASAPVTLRVVRGGAAPVTVAVAAIAAGQSVEVDCGAATGGAEVTLVGQGTTTVASDGATLSYSAPSLRPLAGLRSAPVAAPALRAGLGSAAPAPAATPASPAPAPTRQSAPVVMGARPAPAAPVVLNGTGSTGRPQPAQPASPAPTGASPVTKVAAANTVPAYLSLSKLALRTTPLNQIVPPVNLAPPPPGLSMFTKGETTAMTLAGPTVRKIDLRTLGTNKTIVMQNRKFDFTRFLQSKGSLIPVLEKLQKNPKLFTVNAAQFELLEKNDGFYVRSFLNYSLNLGTCSTAEGRSAVAATGLNCAKPLTNAQRAAAMANPQDSHFVKDPGLRAKRLVEANAQADKQAAQMKVRMAQLRQQLAGAEMRGKLGEGEAARLAALDDDALSGELINAGETKVEETMAVPFKLFVDEKPLLNYPALAGAGAMQSATAPKAATVEIPEYTYLTGFTVGKDYQWRKRIEQTINWCVFGCSETYFVEGYAGFGYGFGLRFPIHYSGNFAYDPAAGKARLTSRMTPFNGGPADYAKAGLADAKIYGGKELVAEAYAQAGVQSHLPLIGDLGVGPVGPKIDFTEYLPSPLKGGQVQPPAPGSETKGAPYAFDTMDLLGNMGNFGAFGAQLFPAVQFGLKSDKLTFQVVDNLNNGAVSTVSDGQGVDLVLKNNVTDFSVRNPVYNVGFTITPGVDARVFLDLAVWSHNWDFFLMFPELEITLPPGGVDFKCHATTICSRSFSYGPDGLKTEAGDPNPIIDAGKQLEKQVKLAWLPKCPSDWCRKQIEFTAQFASIDLGLGWLKLWAEDMQTNSAKWKDPLYVEQKQQQFLNTAGTYRTAADQKAKSWVDQAVAMVAAEKEAAKVGDSMDAIAQLAIAVRQKDCLDATCLAEIDAVGKQMGPAAKAMAAQNPQMTPVEVRTKIAQQFQPKWAEVMARQKVREQYKSDVLAMIDTASAKCKDAVCRGQLATIGSAMVNDAVLEQKKKPAITAAELMAAIKPRYQTQLNNAVLISVERVLAKAALAKPVPTGPITVPRNF